MTIGNRLAVLLCLAALFACSSNTETGAATSADSSDTADTTDLGVDPGTPDVDPDTEPDSDAADTGDTGDTGDTAVVEPVVVESSIENPVVIRLFGGASLVATGISITFTAEINYGEADRTTE
jgi:hypothetical protein